MIGKEKKQRDLETLKKFVTAKEIHGFTSNLWYRALRTWYPFHYIQFMKNYSYKNKSPEAIDFHEKRIRNAIDRVNYSYTVLKKYLLHPPETEEEKVDFDKRVDYLEYLLLKQNKEN